MSLTIKIALPLLIFQNFKPSVVYFVLRICFCWLFHRHKSYSNLTYQILENCCCDSHMQKPFLCSWNPNLIFVLLQVNELYELVKKTETLSQILPQTLDRLLALESLHRQGNTLIYRVTTFLATFFLQQMILEQELFCYFVRKRFISIITKACCSILFWAFSYLTSLKFVIIFQALHVSQEVSSKGVQDNK